MSTIKVLVHEQSLRVIDGPKIASRGVNENYIKFTFDSSWTGFGKVAIFYMEDDESSVYQSIVESDGTALVPWEATSKDGKLCFGVAGTNNDVVYTSEVIKYNIVKGVPVEGSESGPPSPTIYQQMLSLVGQIQSDVDSFEGDTNDRLDIMSSQMDEFIAEHAGTYGKTTLFEGLASRNGDAITLSETCTNFDHISVVYENISRTDEIHMFTPDELNNGVFITSANMYTDPEFETFPDLQVGKVGISPVNSSNPDGVHFQYYQGGFWSWTGMPSKGSDLEIMDAESSHILDAGKIKKVIGYKLVADAELVDARVGVDGTVYQTVGAAIRSQIDELQDGGYVANQQKIQEKIDNWLEEHPEAVTSLEDGAITEAKIHASAVSNTKIQNGAVTDDKTADTYKNLFYDEVIVSTGRTSNTDYYLATVPKLDSENNIIPVSLSYNNAQNPLEQAWEKGSTITVNGYCSVLYQGSLLNGIAICDGTVVNTRSYEGVASDDALYIGIKLDRTIVEYKMNSTVRPADMLADGCTNVFNCYFKLVENGQIVSSLSEGTIIVNGNAISGDSRNPLMLMGVKQNGDIVFLACDGRSIINDGLTYGEAGNILISQGCDTVYNLDGGGSTCLVARGSKLNRNIDESGISVRSVHYAINVIKPSANTPTLGAYAKIGAEKQRIIEQIIPYINEVRDAPAITSLSLTPESENVTITRTNFTKSLKTVTLTAVFTTSASIAKNSNIFSVPSGAKPSATTDFICVDLDGTVFFVSILSSGYIRVLNKGLPAGTYRMNVSWQVA